MKKFSLLIVLSIFLSFFGGTEISASEIETTNLYAYSKDVSDQERYAIEKLGDFIQCHGYSEDVSDLKLGKGIIINDLNDYEKVLFPIWDKNDIVATFLVTKIDETCHGSYSEAYVEQLNVLKNIATQSSPISLVVSNEHFYAIVSNRWYDLNGEIGIYFSQNYKEHSFSQVIDAKESLVYNTYPQSRIPTGYAKPFQIYWVQGNDGYCYAYALANILFNKGYNACLPSYIMAYTGFSSGAYMYQLDNYLASRGLSCTYAERGKLDFSSVKNIIYNQGNYIFVSASNTNNQNVAHAFVLFGYAEPSSGERMYKIWNPWYSYTQTIDASSGIIPTETTTSYIWNNGYLYNIR